MRPFHTFARGGRPSHPPCYRADGKNDEKDLKFRLLCPPSRLPRAAPPPPMRMLLAIRLLGQISPILSGILILHIVEMHNSDMMFVLDLSLATVFLCQRIVAKKFETFGPEREQDQVGAIQHLQAQTTSYAKTS